MPGTSKKNNVGSWRGFQKQFLQATKNLVSTHLKNKIVNLDHFPKSKKYETFETTT